MGQRYGKQLIWIIAGVILAIMVLTVDSKFYAAFANHIYFTTILLLVAVLIFGKEVNGARAWFEFGNVALQPAELGKFATNLAIAKCISQFDFKLQNFRSYLTLGALIGIPAILIILQNDTGSALVFAVFILVFFREGLNGMVLFWGFAAAALFILSLVLDQFQLLIFLLTISVAAYGVLRESVKEALIGIVTISGLFGLIWAIDEIADLGGAHIQLLIVTTSISALLLIIYGIIRHIPQVWRILLFFIFAIGIFFEAVGDWQLAQFKRNPNNSGQVMQTGLWKYTRHPNYFGDTCVWWGIGVVALGASFGWVGLFGSLLMNFFLVRVSGVPMLERSMSKRRPGYDEYKRRTSSFVPRPPKK